MKQIETMNLLSKFDRNEIIEVLSDGLFCQHCDDLLQARVLDLINSKKMSKSSMSRGDTDTSEEFWSTSKSSPSRVVPEKRQSESSTVMSNNSQQRGSWAPSRTPESVYTARNKESPQSVNSKHHSVITNGGAVSSSVANNGISNEENAERIRVAQVGRKKDFYHVERVNDRSINVLQGLELHTKVFNADEQNKIVECVYDLQRVGQNRKLRERTYSEPRKWMRGKGRVTMQFGCCYNYAVDKDGNPPGIVRDEEVDPLPPLFKQMIKRLITWKVLPSTCVPDSCIVNIYDEGDCIPPHIDHHDFIRPFCTVSFLTECNILFGSNLKIVAPGEFSGPVSIPLPVGSVLVLNGNGADIAKHCVPAVPTKRVSITFRKMDDSKLPYRFSPDPELIGLEPIGHSSGTNGAVQHSSQGLVQNQVRVPPSFAIAKDEFPPLGSSEFPPLGSSSSGSKQKNSKVGPRR